MWILDYSGPINEANYGKLCDILILASWTSSLKINVIIGIICELTNSELYMVASLLIDSANDNLTCEDGSEVSYENIGINI